MSLEEALAGRPISTEEPVAWSLDEYPEKRRERRWRRRACRRSLGVPLVATGRLVGALVLSFHQPSGPDSPKRSRC